MADAVSHTSKPKKLPAHQDTPDHPANTPGKFYSNFLYKAALVTVFLVLLPFFPSIAPEFFNQSLHARSWELLQLIFVGIAVSYGLFSKRNDETQKDHGGSKLDNDQSYVSKLLHVSSVFDDESESQTVIQENNKVETLNYKYCRGKPGVVVAEPSPVVFKQDSGCGSSQKPLHLPVRSLEQRIVKEVNALDVGDESGGKIGSINNESRFSSSSRKPIEVGGLSFEKLDDKIDEDVVVLPSPIPWRSRSGRMEMKENDDIELYGIDESTSLKSSSKNLSTPKEPSKSQNKSSEDAVRKKNYFSSSPPQAPPPPTKPQFVRKLVLSKSNSIFTKNAVSPEKLFRRSVSSVSTKELSKSEMEELRRCRIEKYVPAKSIRTYKSNELERKTMDYETKFSKEELVEMMETSDEDMEAQSGEEYFEGITTDNNYNNNNRVTDVGTDVDKKADEFIAKFREQIRLQRTGSIRTSTAPGETS